MQNTTVDTVFMYKRVFICTVISKLKYCFALKGQHDIFSQFYIPQRKCRVIIFTPLTNTTVFVY